MEAQGGRASDPLRERLAAEGRASEFAQAAMLARRLARREGDERGLACTIERGTAYPTAEVERDADGRLRLACLGLSALTGPLPGAYGELLRDEERKGNQAPQAFLELFERRLSALLLGAHLRSRHWLSYAWGLAVPAKTPPRGAFESVLFALLGLPDEASRASAGLPEEALLFYAGILGQRPLSAAALRGVLEDYYGVPARIELFTGQWMETPREIVNSIGRAGAELSENLCLGERFFDPALCFRLDLGPMGLAELQEFLPGAAAAESLQHFLAFAAGPEQAFEYMLALRSAEVSEPRLVGSGDGSQRLGWTLWLRSDDEPREARSGPFRQVLEAPARAGGEGGWKSA